MAGAYTYLPLGLRVLKNIEQIVREEMDAISGQEILMPALHPSDIWKKTGGWDSIDVLFKIKSRTGKDYALGQSEEEVVTPLVKKFIQSYKDLPVAVYHIQNKREKTEGVCDHCGGEIYQRDDDLPETVKKRLQVYQNQTEPLISYYSEKQILKSFDGQEPIAVLFQKICDALEG